MGVSISEKRSPKPISFEIIEGVTLTSTGVVNIHIPFIVNHVDFFPSSFRLDISGKVIYIDPVIVDQKEPADYILITHSHQDHFSIPDLKKLLKKETTVICPKNVYKKLSKVLTDYTVIETKPGNDLNYGDITITSIDAYNIKSGFFVPHPRSAMDVGYIIKSGDVQIYHTGDTDFIPCMLQLENISLVLTPIDGGNLTMTTEKAAKFINNLKPQFVVPMHYNIGTDAIEEFKELVNNDTQVIIMDGQNYHTAI